MMVATRGARLRITFSADDRVLAAGAGALAAVGAIAVTAVRLRGTARFQAARSALLGRPTAYRLHLHGTGIELAPWEHNFVGECVVRRAPESGIYIGPDVPHRPDQGSAVIRDSQIIGAGDCGIRYSGPLPDDEAEGFEDEFADDEADDEPAAGEAKDYRALPAECVSGHVFADEKYGRIADQAEITHLTPVLVACPECGGLGEIKAGRYFLRDGEMVREDIEPGQDA